MRYVVHIWVSSFSEEPILALKILSAVVQLLTKLFNGWFYHVGAILPLVSHIAPLFLA